MEKGLTREHSKTLYGVAIFLMLYHHLYCIPDRIHYEYFAVLDSILGSGTEERIAWFCKICVALYAFISGYAFHRNYNLGDAAGFTLKQGGGFLRKYWLVCVLFIPLCLIRGIFGFDGREIFRHLTLSSTNYNGEWWYARFYITALGTFLLVYIVSEKCKKAIHSQSLGNIASTVCAFVVSQGMAYFIGADTTYMTIVFLGYESSHWKVFESIACFKSKSKVVSAICQALVLLACIAFRARFATSAETNWMDVIIIIPFVYCVVNLSESLVWLARFLKIFGKYSTYMWLTHTIFVYYCFQRFVTISKNSVVMFVQLTIISLITAILLTRVEQELISITRKQSMIKNKIKKGCTIVLAVYMVIAAAFYLVAREQLHYRDEETAMLAAEMPVGELVAGTELRQRFVPETEKLHSLSLMISTYARENTADLCVSVIDANGATMAENWVNAAPLVDSAVTTIAFDAPISLERGAMYDIVLTSNGTAGNAVTVWYGTGVNTARATVNVEIADWEYATVNGQPLPGKLCYAMYGRSYLWVGQYYWYMVAAGALLLAGYGLYTMKKAEQGKYTVVLRLCFALQKYGYLLRQLVGRDFKTKYKRSVLGVFWSFLNPLLTMAVQYIVFSTLFKSDVPNFALYLLIGIVCFSFFNEATSMSLSSIVGNASLINKVYVPKYIYPLSRVISSTVNLLLSLIPLFLVMLITRTPLRPAILLLPFGLICLIAVSLGIGLFLSTSMVFFRDTQFLWGVLSMIWMYATPIFYPETIIPARFMILYKCNPLYHVLRFMRTIMINGVSPEPKAYVLCLIACFAPLVIGAWAFKKNQDKFVLYL